MSRSLTTSRWPTTMSSPAGPRTTASRARSRRSRSTIRVTNLQTGNNATSPQNFTYGDILYVGQANPTEGQIGDLLTLYGAGFEDPLTVWFSGDIEFDVISVTGTELTLRSPPDLAPTCSDRSGNFRVVLNESNREATGGNYTLLGSDPTITSVDPIFVDETDFGNGVDPSGDRYLTVFDSPMISWCEINNFTIAPNEIDGESRRAHPRQRDSGAERLRSRLRHHRILHHRHRSAGDQERTDAGQRDSPKPAVGL